MTQIYRAAPAGRTRSFAAAFSSSNFTNAYKAKLLGVATPNAAPRRTMYPFSDSISERLPRAKCILAADHVAASRIVLVLERGPGPVRRKF